MTSKTPGHLKLSVAAPNGTNPRARFPNSRHIAFGEEGTSAVNGAGSTICRGEATVVSVPSMNQMTGRPTYPNCQPSQNIYGSRTESAAKRSVRHTCRCHHTPGSDDRQSGHQTKTTVLGSILKAPPAFSCGVLAYRRRARLQRQRVVCGDCRGTPAWTPGKPDSGAQSVAS